MSAITQRLQKEVVTFEEVEQIVAHKEDLDEGNGAFILISSNSTDDHEKSLLNARKALDYDHDPIVIEIEDEDEERVTVAINAHQALRIGTSLIAMANFLLDTSNYREVE